MKNFIISAITLICISGSMNAQDKLEQAGFYDSEIKTIERKSAGKSLIFFPMKHVGTEKFYNDIKSKIEILKKEGYYFLYEKVTVDAKDEITRRKLKKITGDIGISPEKGYVQLLKEHGVKMKEELLEQPSYSDFGLDESNSKNVDVTALDIVKYYEKNYGEIKLNKCEMENAITAKDSCRGTNLKKKYRKDAIVTFRDKVIVDGIIREKSDKIALIYGKGHLQGVLNKINK